MIPFTLAGSTASGLAGIFAAAQGDLPAHVENLTILDQPDMHAL
jgi:hypothetical protein